MFTNGFYGNGSSVTHRLAVEEAAAAVEGSSGREGFGGRYAQAGASMSYYPDLDIQNQAVHQKLDSIECMLGEHKAETRAENHKLKEEIVQLHSEFAEMKRKLEERVQASQSQLPPRARIPHDLSVSEHCRTATIALHYSCISFKVRRL